MSITNNLYIPKLNMSVHNPRPIYLDEENAFEMIESAARNIPKMVNNFNGEGIIICAGGEKYLTNAYINIRNLRDLGVDWPIQIWHLGEKEIIGNFRNLVEHLDVQFIDALKLMKIFPLRNARGFEHQIFFKLKPYAAKFAPFNKILLLDADSFAVQNPLFIFETKEFITNKAIFFRDQSKIEEQNPIWKLMGLDFRDEYQFESGQVFLEKNESWEPLCLAVWINEYSDFFYDKFFHGDKESFHFSWMKLNKPYYLSNAYYNDGHSAFQYWGKERLVFQHRSWDKFSLKSQIKSYSMGNLSDKDFLYLEDLRKKWVY